MLLVGQFDSPYVRRVAISMRVLGIEFEHAPWSIGRMLCTGGGCGPSASDGVAMPDEWSNDELSPEDGPEPSAELRELEDELCRLAGILAVRIVGDRAGRPLEVHVLSDQAKPAKQTVRRNEEGLGRQLPDSSPCEGAAG